MCSQNPHLFLGTLQHQLELASEKERSSTEITIEVRSKLKVLEKQNKNLKDEKFKLQLQLEEGALKVQEIQNDWLRQVGVKCGIT